MKIKPTVIIHTGGIVRDVSVNNVHGTYKVHRLPSGWYVNFRGEHIGTERTRRLAQCRIVKHIATQEAPCAKTTK